MHSICSQLSYKNDLNVGFNVSDDSCKNYGMFYMFLFIRFFFGSNSYLYTVVTVKASFSGCDFWSFLLLYLLPFCFKLLASTRAAGGREENWIHLQQPDTW